MSGPHNFGGSNPIGGPPGRGDPPPTEQQRYDAPPQQWQPAPGPQQWSGPPPTQQPPQWNGGAPGYQQPPAQGGFAGPPPYPGQPGQQWGQFPFDPNFAPRTRRNRKPLVIGLGAVVAVVILVIGGVLILGGSDSSGGGGAKSPGDAIKGYLEALARGDAAGALSLSSANPPDKTFLTDEILKKQNDKYPITNIKILSEKTWDKGGSAHVRADFGGVTSDQEVTMPKPANGEWKLDAGVAEIETNMGDYNSQKILDMVTIFGKPAPKSGKAYLFPGWVEFGSSNPNVAIGANSDAPPNLQDVWLGVGGTYPQFGLSKDGQKAIIDAIKSMTDECAKSKQLSPPNCPNSFEVPGTVDGSAQWTGPTNFDEVEAQSLDPREATVSVYGSTDWKLTVQTDRGPYTTDTTEYINGKADITQNPPKITLDN